MRVGAPLVAASIVLGCSGVRSTSADAGDDLHTDGGGPVRVLVPDSAAADLVVSGAYVYWTNPRDGRVERQPIEGGGGRATVADGQVQPFGVAADSSHVCWTTRGGSPAGGGGAVWCCEAPVCAAPKLVAGGQASPAEIAIALGFAYWGTSGGDVTRAPVDASAGAEVVAAGGSSPRFVRADAHDVYWADGCGLFRHPLAGGGSPTRVGGASPFCGATGLAVDVDALYVTTSTLVAQVPLAGGDPVFAKKGVDDPAAIVVDSRDAYWLDRATSATSGAGGLVRVTKAGIAGDYPPEVLTPARKGERMTQDAKSVYFATNDGRVDIVQVGK